MNIKDKKIRAGNFLATLNGTIAADKVEELIEDGLSFRLERDGLSKVFKGVKERNSVAYSADMAAVVKAKLADAMKGFFADLEVVITAREWSEGAGGAQKKAQAAYDEMLALGLDAGMSLKVAQKVHAGFAPGAKAEEKIEAPAIESEAEKPMDA